MTESANKRLRDKGMSANEVTVFLQKTTSIRNFKCAECGAGIMKFQERMMALVFGNFVDIEHHFSTPKSVQCQKCGTIYHFQSFLE